jgi:hypothetical protein
MKRGRKVGSGGGTKTPPNETWLLLIAGAGLGGHCQTPAATIISCQWGQNGELTPGHLLPPRGLVPGLVLVVKVGRSP